MNKYILVTDPAVDTEAEGYDREKFVETGDMKYLPLKEGERPVIYTLDRPTVEIFDHATNQPTSVTQALEFVAFCLKSIDDKGNVKTFRTKRVPGIGERIVKDDLARIWTPIVFRELAARCVYLATLPPLS